MVRNFLTLERIYIKYISFRIISKGYKNSRIEVIWFINNNKLFKKGWFYLIPDFKVEIRIRQKRKTLLRTIIILKQ